MPGQRLFLIIENPKERMTYTDLFETMGFLVDAVPEGSDAITHVLSQKPAVVVADDGTPGFSALDFLKQAADSDTGVPKTIILTPDPVMDYAVSLMQHGAMDYLIKPVDPRQLELSVKKSLVTAFAPVPAAKGKTVKHKAVQIITKDPKMARLLKLAARVADSSASVLIQGESGTGKELLARFLHEKSTRRQQPFIAINCAALPETLLESELFGHEKGAFTGALAKKAGKFELADKGTLFLDEITEMQFHLQSKLLRVLQEKVVDRVGGTQPVDVDVRIIATTNRDAKTAIEDQAFREDLFYRLNTIPLIIPPLRERSQDIQPLCDFFIKKYCRIDARSVKGLTDQARSMLKNHSFPGNVRELENIIHRAVLLAETDMITPSDLLMDDGAETAFFDDTGIDSVANEDFSAVSLKEMEEKMIFRTLDQTEGNRTHAAKILGISVRTLRNKLNEYKEPL
ncbi:sigma-54-dependent Fis family transcriptional regulator [Desulfobacter hydrogenophilus]|uniref:Sigma-54-dependent Fis family transcriptional regulator n=1 Tax=Desulfobacter hydrogenophilus TaxID=2291 RepID=A0A328FLM4_9BACT|nr:sigma-54 dependent transcriptional regulator [Desulfobacter hydrogenophilus]NDY73391.1 sigma-54-dependent Fis family transcriptional regulator [Desulfobacter hydrogenophilus]QBH12953.1 sigma-54-dependent Fis family transcriptional regulator [Desulfobacter hydrogenophilus]RAM03937.1 sigma-54-dependent Fis family transcriptional regulator [Desulfobacter hydrogenophilus]